MERRLGEQLRVPASQAGHWPAAGASCGQALLLSCGYWYSQTLDAQHIHPAHPGATHLVGIVEPGVRVGVQAGLPAGLGRAAQALRQLQRLQVLRARANDCVVDQVKVGFCRARDLGEETNS